MEKIEKVIGALKVCDHNDTGIGCGECPYRDEHWNGAWVDDDGSDCQNQLTKDVLELLERLIPMKPHHTKVQYADGHEWITDQCPACVENSVGIWDSLIDRGKKFCTRCGQAIDWSEYDGRDQIDWDEYMKHLPERVKRWENLLQIKLKSSP